MWSYTFYLIRSSAAKYEAYEALLVKTPNKDFDDSEEASLLKVENQKNNEPIVFSTSRSFKQEQDRSSMVSHSIMSTFSASIVGKFMILSGVEYTTQFHSQNSIRLDEVQSVTPCNKLKEILLEIVEEVKAPPTLAAVSFSHVIHLNT